MARFGDDDPRDAWDDNDEPHIRLAVLKRIIAILELEDLELRAWISRKLSELDG